MHRLKVTKAIENKLKAAGYSTVEKIAVADADELAGIKGITAYRAESLIEMARDALAAETEASKPVLQRGGEMVNRSVRVQRIFDAAGKGQ